MATRPAPCRRDRKEVISYQFSVFSFQFSAGCESTVFPGNRPKGQHNAIKLFFPKPETGNRKPENGKQFEP
jgi:hypothetical protein